MAWPEAVAAAYSAASEYYKDQSKKRFMDSAIAKLVEIDKTTKETLAITQEILRWTQSAPELIKLYDAMTFIKGAAEQIAGLIHGLGESPSKDKYNKDQIADINREVTEQIIFLKDQGGYVTFPQIAGGIAVLLIANAPDDFLSRGTLMKTLKSVLNFYRESLAEVPDVNAKGQKPFGWQVIHAKEVREQYVPFLEHARAQSFEDRYVITYRGGPTILPGGEGGAYVGLRGNWSDGFAGISSFDGCFIHLSDTKFLVDFKPAPGSRTLPKEIKLAPIKPDSGKDPRSYGDSVAGELNGMIQERNWALKNEAQLLEACATLRDLISKLEKF